MPYSGWADRLSVITLGWTTRAPERNVVGARNTPDEQDLLMRRVLLAVLAGGLLLTGAACGDDAQPTAGAPASPTTPSDPPSSSPEPDYSDDTAQICGKLQTLYKGELRDFGAAMGKVVSYRETKQTPGPSADPQQIAGEKAAEKAAATELAAAGTKIRKLTATAQDPELRTAGATSAAKLEHSAKDRRYITGTKTLKALNATIESQFTEWLTPVAGFCVPQ
jgi:hypothetical protein